MSLCVYVMVSKLSKMSILNNRKPHFYKFNQSKCPLIRIDQPKDEFQSLFKFQPIRKIITLFHPTKKSKPN